MNFPPTAVKNTIGPQMVPYVKFTGPKSTDFTDDLLELSVNEKEGGLVMFDVTLRDDRGINNAAARTFDPFKIEWGVRPVKPNIFVQTLENEISDRNEWKRGPYDVMLMSAATRIENNTAKLKLSFIQGDRNGVGKKRSRTFTTGTYGKLVEDLCDEIRASSTVDFKAQDIGLTEEVRVVQDGITNIELLGRLARDLGCKLTFQHDRTRLDRIAHVFFLDYAREARTRYAFLRGMFGRYHILQFGNPYGNIITGDMDRGFASPNGSTVRSYTDSEGRTRFIVTVSETERTIIYELNAREVRKALEELQEPARSRLRDRIAAARFEDFDYNKPFYRRYFQSTSSTTAPEGIGLVAKFPIIVNPHIFAGDPVWLGPIDTRKPSKIPSQYRTDPRNWQRTLWFVRSSKQVINAEGYKHSLEIRR